MSVHHTQTHASDKPLQQYFSKDEAAEFLGVSPKTVSRLIALGELPASRVGSRRAIRIHRRDLEKVMKPVPSLASLRGEAVA